MTHSLSLSAAVAHGLVAHPANSSEKTCLCSKHCFHVPARRLQPRGDGQPSAAPAIIYLLLVSKMPTDVGCTIFRMTSNNVVAASARGGKMQNASLFPRSKMIAIKCNPLLLSSLIAGNLVSILTDNQQCEFLKDADGRLAEHRRRCRKGLSLVRPRSGRPLQMP
jgi:hypothetical protein